MNQPESVFTALASANIERVHALLDEDPSRAATKSDDGLSLLLMALYSRQGALAEAIRAKLDSIDLHEAAALGEEHSLLRELDVPSDGQSEPLHRRSPDGFTALHLACFFGHPSLAQLLVQRGAKVDAIAANPSRVAPLHSAAAGASAPSVSLLLEAGANPNCLQQGGHTPLMSAASIGSVTMVETLLAAGADPAAESDEGHTARSLAKSKGQAAVLALLGG